MKTLVAMLTGLVLAMTAYPAAAYVVAVTTSIPAQSVADDDGLEAALKSAIDDVLQHVVAFRPTFVTVQSARAVGGRVYILLLIGDDDGAATLKTLSDASETTSY
jgi:Cu/Ag efflux pump CusA